MLTTTSILQYDGDHHLTTQLTLQTSLFSHLPSPSPLFYLSPLPLPLPLLCLSLLICPSLLHLSSFFISALPLSSVTTPSSTSQSSLDSSLQVSYTAHSAGPSSPLRALVHLSCLFLPPPRPHLLSLLLPFSSLLLLLLCSCVCVRI